MMKHLSLLATAILCVSTALASPNIPQGVKPLKVKNTVNTERTQAPVRAQVNTTIPDDACEMYAFQVYGNGAVSNGFLQFPSYDLSDREFLYDYGTEDGHINFPAGTFVGDTYYAMVTKSWSLGAFIEPVALATVDLETGEYKSVADYSETLPWNEVFYEMSYDPNTQLIYAAQAIYNAERTGFAGTNIWTIDPSSSNLQPTYAVTLGEYLWTMAVDNGMMYGIVQDYAKGEPKSIRLVSAPTANLKSGNGTLTSGATIDGGNRVIDYSQTMEFDHSNHTLWWAGQAPGDQGGWICKINIEDGSLYDFNEIPLGSQYVALGIPYQTAVDAAPAYVTNFAVTPGEKGALSVTITWNNPTTNYAGTALSELSGVQVYRNGDLLEDMTSVEMGAAQSYTDSNAPEGLNTYTVLPYNSAGNGIYKERTVYVGVDVPAAVTNVTIVPDGEKATISWTAPTVGLNGGYIDVNDTKYDIFRTPNDAVVKSGTSETTIVDVVPEYNGYKYTITAKNSKGAGGMYVSAPVAFGPGGSSLPYVNNIDSEEDFTLLNVIDKNNDGYTWHFLVDPGTHYNPTESYGTAEYYYNSYSSANDYLVTPQFNVLANEEYEVMFEYLTSNWSGCKEKMRVLVSNDPTFATSECILDLTNMPSAEGEVWRPKSVTFKATESGLNYVAFQVYSDADQGFVHLKNIVIRHISSTDLKAEKVFGSDVAYVNSPITHRVNVTNTGKADLNYGVVKLYDDNDNELGKAYIDYIAVGETKTIDVKWTPSTLGKMNIWGVVELNGDTYTGDNKAVVPVTVEVLEDDGSDKWFSIGIIDNQGWRPIFLEFNYSELQTLYYAKDIMVKSFEITGMQYLYNPPTNTAGLNAVPISIYMQNTSAESLTGLLPAETFTLVYQGNVSITGQDERNAMTVKFDTPFEYTGENVVVKVVCDKPYALPNVEWLVMDENYSNLPCRSWSAYGSSASSAQAEPYENYVIPYLRFSYNYINSVDNINYQSELVASKCGNLVCFNMLCDVVNVYSIAGELVYTASSVESVDLSQLSAGVYVVKAVSGNNAAVLKVLK